MGLLEILGANVKVVSSAVVFNNDLKIILVQSNKPKYRGFWGLPGGTVELRKGEDPYDALIREISEETGLSLNTLSILYGIGLYVGETPSRTPMLNQAYAVKTESDCKPEDFRQPNDEIMAVKAFTYSEIPPESQRRTSDMREILDDLMLIWEGKHHLMPLDMIIPLPTYVDLLPMRYPGVIYRPKELERVTR